MSDEASVEATALPCRMASSRKTFEKRSIPNVPITSPMTMRVPDTSRLTLKGSITVGPFAGFTAVVRILVPCANAVTPSMVAAALFHTQLLCAVSYIRLCPQEEGFLSQGEKLEKTLSNQRDVCEYGGKIGREACVRML